MELAQLCFQLALQQTHALDRETGAGRMTGRGQKPVPSHQLYCTLCLGLRGTHPSPLCTRDALEWPRPGCPGPRGSPESRCCRHGPCCRRHPGDAAAHSMTHTVHQSGQRSGWQTGTETHCWGCSLRASPRAYHHPLSLTPDPRPQAASTHRYAAPVPCWHGTPAVAGSVQWT